MTIIILGGKAEVGVQKLPRCCVVSTEREGEKGVGVVGGERETPRENALGAVGSRYKGNTPSINAPFCHEETEQTCARY